MKLIKFTIMLALAANFALAATHLTFTFDNGQVTNNGVKKYEFDVMAQANNDTTHLGDTQVYINYDTAGFGASVANNGKITVEKGKLLQGELAAGLPLYEIVKIADNTSSRFAVTAHYKYEDNSSYANVVTTSPKQLLHISIEIADSNQNAGLSYEQSLMDGQEYYANNNDKFSPIIADDTLDAPLKLNPADITNLDTGIPNKFNLYNNFPNPFNPSTTLKFDLPQNVAKVQLVIYDSLGQKVAVLYSGALMAGRYSYIWNGKSQFGNSMPSGIYFASFKADNYSRTIRMMLIK